MRGVWRPDNDIVDTVAVDITCTCESTPLVVIGRTLKAKAICPVEVGKPEALWKSRFRTKDDVVQSLSMCRERGLDDQVDNSIAIHIASARAKKPGVAVISCQPKALCNIEAAEIDAGGKSGPCSKH